MSTTYTVISVRQDNCHVVSSGLFDTRNVTDYITNLISRNGHRYIQHLVVSTDVRDETVLLTVFNADGMCTKRVAIRGEEIQ